MDEERVHVPEFITQNKNLRALVNNSNGKRYEDNLGIFRCLALHKGHLSNLETRTKRLYKTWCQYLQNQDDQYECPPYDEYHGLDLNQEIHEFEKCFEVCVNIFNLREDGTTLPERRSVCRFKEQMNLNKYEIHLSYITNLKAYSKRYQCQICETFFPTAWRCLKHELICSSKTKFKFPGGFHEGKENIFEQLREFGCVVPAHDRVYEWFIVFDFEAILRPETDIPRDRKLQWQAEHVPISVSVCSNVEHYKEPICFVEEDPDKLIQVMVTYMEEIATHCNSLALDKWGAVIESLEEKLAHWRQEEEKVENSLAPTMIINELTKMLGRFNFYCQQVPVLGFNSARYDLNLIKKSIAKHLCLHESQGITIKKNNSYTCLSNDSLRFLDIKNFLAPGTSYSSFLKAYGIAEAKGFFPYEYLTDFSCLDERELPPHTAFYSSLKQCNINEEEYNFCKDIWKQEKMTCLRDFLIWYNNLDVAPFVIAVLRLQEFYFERNIDIFKTAMSVPGIARQMLFSASRRSGASFSLFGEEDKDLFYTVKNNIIGGPSIIFQRYAKATETFIRNNPEKPCKRIVGYDANALYLWALDQEMPTGAFVRRRQENDFRPEVREKYISQYNWLNWLSHNSGLNIQHKMNTGHEKRIGPYPVDGYCSETKTVFQFHGCYFHGHECVLTKSIRNKKWLETKHQKFQRTKETTDYIKQQGYQVIEIWECKYKELKKESSNLRTIIDDSLPSFFKKHKGTVTENQMLQAIYDGSLFGMVEIDITTPEKWEDGWQRDLSPYEHFEEMAPIFCTVDIPFDIIGQHMQEHVTSNNLSEKPRRLLIGGMRARKILIATPLVQWYLSQGLQVTRIYQVVEYVPMRCFREFVRDVSAARRLGDTDTSMSVIADTQKLIGNCGYGGLIMDQSKHRHVTYVQGANAASQEVNNPLFMAVTELQDEVYEVEKAKKMIIFDLPIQLGYFILQYAKLRMLQFYYDFMDSHVHRTDFQYCEMDTDSAYTSISGSSLEDVIRPEMLDSYRHGLYGYCSDVDIEADDKFHWFPRQCCEKHKKYDKRTPGLFKLEFEGDEMVSLCSKTYLVSKTQSRDIRKQLIAEQILRRAKKCKVKRALRSISKTCRVVKFSCKGVSKRFVESPLYTFKRVLKTKKHGNGVTKGFRARNNGVLPINRNGAGSPTFITRDKFSLMESIQKCWTLSCAQKKGIPTTQTM